MASFFSGSTLSREQVAKVLYDAGIRGDDLWKLVAIGGRESGYDPGAHRTDSARQRLSGDRGLFQINSVWDTQLMAAGIISKKEDLFDPAVNARAAAFVLQKQGYAAWGMQSGGGYNAGGNPLNGTDTKAAQEAVNRFMSNPQQYGASSSSGGGSTAMAGSIDLPDDAVLVAGSGGWVNALFNLGNGVWIRYNVPPGTDLSGKYVNRNPGAGTRQIMKDAVSAGHAQELSEVKATYGSFSSFWNSIVGQTVGWQNPASKDPGVLKVLAQFAGRPDMSEAELENLLKGTQWWSSRTESELRWNSLSPAEQQTQRRDMAARMKATWQQFTGEGLSPQAIKNDPSWEKLASGKMTFSEWTETVVKPAAMKIAESPWARERRSEEEQQRQRGVDIENTRSKLRQSLQQWGLQWGEQKLTNWATQIVEKKKSDDDFIEALKNQANVKYAAWKRDPNIDVATAAAPWLDTYNRVMEDSGTVFTPEIAKALQAGRSVADFEVELKKSQKWLGTKNARNEMFSLANEMGTMLGFE